MRAQAVEEALDSAQPTASLQALFGANVAALKDLTKLVRGQLTALQRKVRARGWHAWKAAVAAPRRLLPPLKPAAQSASPGGKDHGPRRARVAFP